MTIVFLVAFFYFFIFQLFPFKFLPNSIIKHSSEAFLKIFFVVIFFSYLIPSALKKIIINKMLSQMLNRNQIALKTFVLQNQNTQVSQVVLLPVDYGQKHLDLQQLFTNKIENYKKCQYRLYDFHTNEYVPLSQITDNFFKIPIEFILACTSLVLIKYKLDLSQDGNSFKQTQSQEDEVQYKSDTSSMKKQRSKERVIAEVIQIIKRWRDIHNQKRGQKRISLQQAAKIIGLPKKSLDDYYYQLRLGQKYGFDFKNNFYERIGTLRNFLKQKKPRLKSQTSDKHTKNLKVIEKFEQLLETTKYMKMEEQQIYEQNQQMSNQMRQKIQEERIKNCEVKLQSQFYEDFGFLDAQQDPYINLDPNFKKKKEEKIFDQQLFF